MLEFEPTDHRGSMANTAAGSGRNGNEAGDALEPFARWLHHRCVPVELPLAGKYDFAVLFSFDTSCTGRHGCRSVVK